MCPENGANHSIGSCLTILLQSDGVSLPLPSITLTNLDHVLRSDFGLSPAAM